MYKVVFAIMVIFCSQLSYSKVSSSINVKLVKIPQLFDPSYVMDTSSALVLGQIYQGLYKYNNLNQIEPVLVKSQKWNKDFTSLELQIDENVIFSDGEKLTPLIVKNSIEILASNLKKQSGWMIGDIDGFNDYITGNAKNIRGLKIDKNKLSIFFSKPSQAFINYLASPNMLIVKRNKKQPSELIGTGLFELNFKSKHKVILHLKKTESGNQDISEIIFSDSYINTYDLSFDSNYMQQLDSYQYDYLQAIVLIFNTKHSTFLSSVQRCHLTKIFDDAFKDSEYNLQPISLGLPFSWSISSFNKTLIGSNKFVQKNKINVIYANSAGVFNSKINDKLQKVLGYKGIDLSFNEQKIDDLIRNLTNGSFDVALLGYVPDFPSADAILTPFVVSQQQYNFSRFSYKALDNILISARNTKNKSEQNVLYKKAFDILYSKCPVAYLGTQKGTLYRKKNLYIPKFSSLGFHKLDLSELHWEAQ